MKTDKLLDNKKFVRQNILKKPFLGEKEQYRKTLMMNFFFFNLPFASFEPLTTGIQYRLF